MRDGVDDAGAPLTRPIECDQVIIGAGITGALVADALCGRGTRVVVLDQREVAEGSTAASTALLQYEIDTHLTKLEVRLGAEPARRCYLAGIESLALLEARAAALGLEAEFTRHESLYVASSDRDLVALQAELAARRAIGIEAEWLNPGVLRSRFGVHKSGAILSAAGAQLDPVRFTRALLVDCRRRGAEVFTRSTVTAIEARADSVLLTLATGARVVAADVLVCAGYESLRFLPFEVATLHNTFAVVTEPTLSALAAQRMPLVWESARPYLYARSTRDGRLIVGGADVGAHSALARQLFLPQRVRAIARRYEAIFGTQLPPLAGAWAGTFAETADGLPFIGAAPGLSPRIRFALCYGGNGITYSVHAGAILRAAIEGNAHPLADVFGFGRQPLRASSSREGSTGLTR